jgi:hypothetical protein
MSEMSLAAIHAAARRRFCSTEPNRSALLDPNQFTSISVGFRLRFTGDSSDRL